QQQQQQRGPAPVSRPAPAPPGPPPPHTSSMERLLNEWLWQQHYWFPPGMGWKDMEAEEEAEEVGVQEVGLRVEVGWGRGRYPLPRDLLCTLPLALCFIALRCVFE
ncbi:hypothetical protein CRUP_034135, partial [Coryphaenoides rupestris]